MEFDHHIDVENLSAEQHNKLRIAPAGLKATSGSLSKGGLTRQDSAPSVVKPQKKPEKVSQKPAGASDGGASKKQPEQPKRKGLAPLHPNMARQPERTSSKPAPAPAPSARESAAVKPAAKPVAKPAPVVEEDDDEPEGYYPERPFTEDELQDAAERDIQAWRRKYAPETTGEEAAARTARILAEPPRRSRAYLGSDWLTEEIETINFDD